MKLLDITNSIFKDRTLYKEVTSKEKDTNFFIINR